MLNKKTLLMGGTGNGTWAGGGGLQTEAPNLDNYKLKETAPKKELAKSAEELERLAQERERKAELKAMTPETRAEHFASKKMLDTYLKKEYSKWEKGERKGGHQKGWVEGKLPEIKKQWEKGGLAKWIKSNSRQAKSIQERAKREEAWRSRKK